MINNSRRLTGILVILCFVFAAPVYTDIGAVSAESQPAVAKSSSLISVFNNFGEDPATEHNFTWNTAPADKTGFIQYFPKTKFKSFTGSNVTTVIAQSFPSRNDLDRRVIHKVSLKNLKPGTEYIYRVGNGTALLSTEGTFKTAPANPEPFTFIQVTDTQGLNVQDYMLWKNTLDQALKQVPDARFLLHTGDMVDSGQRIVQWDLFAGAVKPELMSIPIEPAVGNHEAVNSNLTNLNEKNFSERFNLPDENTGAPPGTVYSFDYGYAHIAVLNTECSENILKKEADWLKTDMTNSDKPRRIISLHRGLYGATYDSKIVRNAWAPVFDELGIDLVLQGHDHNYLRTYPMKNSAKVKTGKGTVYLTANTGGAKFYPKKSRYWQAVDLQPYTQMYVAVMVDKNKLTVTAYDVNNTVKDSFTLTK